MKQHFLRSLCASLAASALLASAMPARAQRLSASDASALSLLPVAVLVAAPALILSAGVTLTVVAVEASAKGSVWVLERASDGARCSLQLAAGASALIGTGVLVTVVSAGWLLSAAGPGHRLRAERDRRLAAVQRAGDPMRPRAWVHRALAGAAGALMPRGRCLGLAMVLALPLATAAPPALAGRPCEERPAEPAAVENGLNLALRTARALDASGAQVVILARAGQDLSKYGLQWSHLGFAYRDSDAGQPIWRVMHKLNHCGSAEAALYRQGLGEFFLDRPHRYLAAYVALTPELQARLLPLLKDNARAAQLNQRHYNMLAYPWSTTYQQSNQWAIETLAMAADGASTRRQAQAWLRSQGYQPTALHLGPLTRLGARATAANVAFDDHPNDKRFADRIETVTVDSVFAWLARAGLGSAAVTLH